MLRLLGWTFSPFPAVWRFSVCHSLRLKGKKQSCFIFYLLEDEQNVSCLTGLLMNPGPQESVWKSFTKRNVYFFLFFMCVWIGQSTWSLIKQLLLLMWIPASQHQCDDWHQKPARGENTHEKWNPLPPYHWATVQFCSRHCNFLFLTSCLLAEDK